VFAQRQFLSKPLIALVSIRIAQDAMTPMGLGAADIKK
jgi:hypothetical protein